MLKAEVSERDSLPLIAPSTRTLPPEPAASMATVPVRATSPVSAMEPKAVRTLFASEMGDPLPSVDAVISMSPLIVDERVEPLKNPQLPVPDPPKIESVAVRLPPVEKAAGKLTPWLVAPLPPVHPKTVTEPSVIEEPKTTGLDVPVVQDEVTETPWESAEVASLVPLM